MARTRGPGGRSRGGRGGGTAASVAVPRRSARLAGGNQDVHGRVSTLVWQPRPFALLGKGLASAVSISCTSHRDFCDPIRLQKRTAESINYEYS